MNPRKKFKPRNSNSNSENEGPVTVNMMFEGTKPAPGKMTNHQRSRNSNSKSSRSSPHHHHHHSHHQLSLQQTPQQQHHQTTNDNTKRQPTSNNITVPSESATPRQQHVSKTTTTTTTPTRRSQPCSKRSPQPGLNRKDFRLRCHGNSKTDRYIASPSTPAVDFTSPKFFSSPKATEVPLPPTHWVPMTQCSREVLIENNMSAQLKSLLNVA